MVLASQVHEGMALRIGDQVYKVLECQFKAGAGQQGGVVKMKLRSASSGRVSEPHFRPEEKLEDLQPTLEAMDFIYADATSCTFMDPDSFEQVEIPRELLGRVVDFLREGMRLTIEFFEGRPISVNLPESVELRIVETAAPTHAGQDSTWKEAELETGMKLQVPLFAAPGELVRVDTRTGRYIERVRAEKKRSA
jgi:elongation factor P